jgi:predicted AAA+ superfamily ATPase
MDMGVRNALINDFGPKMDGKGFENYVVSELIKSGFVPRFWRTKSGAEVDVVLEIGRELIPIEIKTTYRKMRIERGFRSFLEKYSPERAFLVGYDVEGSEIKENRCRIKAVSIMDLIKELSNLDR